jgi:pyruvate formate lyase activating enzyme
VGELPLADQQQWRSTWHPARLEERLEGDVVRCHLSPRNCRIRPGQHGFCRVRANRGGRLVSLNYGKSVHATEETIETEAVFHHSPGERILSMGNVGCMLNCDYCHNWRTSQARFVQDAEVFTYSPRDVIDIAKRHGIRVISWTYNDPVVWHEFVVETSALAQQEGITTLYKSAFFITPRAIEELLGVIDIFSISLKSMDPEYYRKLTKGWIEPVLAGIEQVYESGRHLEISTLMVTDRSDGPEVARACSQFILERLDAQVPLHFVRFHPDYKMVDTIRTPIERLVEARSIARDMGVRHVYLGNVFDSEFTDTACRSCGALLVSRYGLSATVLDLDEHGHCTRCGNDAHVVMPRLREPLVEVPDCPGRAHRLARFDWHGDVRSLHVRVQNPQEHSSDVYHRSVRIDGPDPSGWSKLTLDPAESYRFIVSAADVKDVGVEVAVEPGVTSTLHEVFDRAHFPTEEVSGAGSHADATPLPLYETRLVELKLRAGKTRTGQPDDPS